MSSVQSLLDYGNAGMMIDIECTLSNNLPTIVIVGYANRAVDEARERVRGAFSSSGLALPRKRITINLAPADIPKASSSFDLAIAAAILQTARDAAHRKAGAEASELQPSVTIGTTCAVIGELGLDGGVRPVRGMIGKLLAGRAAGIRTFIIPAANIDQALLIPDITIYPVATLADLAHHLQGTVPLQPHTVTAIPPAQSSLPPMQLTDNTADAPDLGDIIGQEQAKRALEIVAAGGHNILLSGPPGTGKSMLARALPGILPPLTTEEMLAVTQLHSLSSKQYQGLVTTRPFRAPHHSGSHVAIVGGGPGMAIKPGEVSLAHHGVLFFDEFPEFNRATIEALRQPLEDRRIVIARANERLEFPANFILVATANPCPCGYYGPARTPRPGARDCQCPPAAVQRYRSKLSGPILDRIDIHSDVHEIDHRHLLSKPSRAHSSEVRRKVIAARGRQSARYGGDCLNADMSNEQIRRYAPLRPEPKDLLDNAARNLDLSARAYMRTIKVARTIADLDDADDIGTTHISEALQYRSRSGL